MSIHPLAGKPAPQQQLVNVPALISRYYTFRPDVSDVSQQVAFGTSGHRGSSLNSSFTDTHIAAICQALVEYREQQNITGPLFIGKDTHALSEAAFSTAVEVLSANDIKLVVQTDNGYTPTPVISHRILQHNATQSDKADGIVITPSHNPPEDGGFKYNAVHGGPAETDITSVIQQRANQIIANGNKEVKRQPFADALQQVTQEDFSEAYIADLANVVDMQAIANAKLKLATDPLGGAGMAYWAKIAEKYGLNIEVVNEKVDPTFSFMRLDKDGKIRMDCSSPYAMAGLIDLKDGYDLAFGNDPDFDRHGIVDPHLGLMNPNHYLAVAIDYLYRHRPNWSDKLKIGKTLVSSSLIDRVANGLNRELAEMPVGFKWFVDGMLNGTIGFAGEESAGGIYLRRDGNCWATDKDGIILCLLAAEITAVTGMTPGQYYLKLVEQYAKPSYKRIDVAASLEQKQILSQLNKQDVKATELAGEKIEAVMTHAPGNNAAIGGVKVCAQNGWFAARPSGTENVYKIYAESFLGEDHLNQLVSEAEQLVSQVFEHAGV
ncbi:phosphoglucomutase (alpha-D-glucose-1,6-bisphosphate-dependent) [Neptunicella marina]|uniref:Phosphoglucomutase n=1 Tax=Neptunicella marina TaxID=2125989 RepID=A0A8J6IPP6_9ALTE|nr:phosphoglucomutase (alpha-D-glucose-1,6-bisphosphate-dependent) [Neptunicella marina]MBC3764339.1 alpha-D-glucose phosphate-specific phosphoglucomutase [Neptunicella marina]